MAIILGLFIIISIGVFLFGNIYRQSKNDESISRGEYIKGFLAALVIFLIIVFGIIFDIHMNL
jgi:4-hydroxybenzoate polyprenyltransferase